MIGMIAFATAVAALPVKAPVLISSVPSNGAVLAAGETELVWTFDQPMQSQGHSITGRADLQPQFIGAPVFSKGKREFRQRMVLKPGRRYDIGVNSRSFRNFRSASGLPAREQRIRFSTKP